MKDIYISDIKTHQELISYFLVKTSAVKVGSNKKAYLDLLLADCTGEISAKKWDIADEELPGLEKIKEGSSHQSQGVSVTEWNGMKQLRVSQDPPDFSRRPPGYERLHQSCAGRARRICMSTFTAERRLFRIRILEDICIRELDGQ